MSHTFSKVICSIDMENALTGEDKAYFVSTAESLKLRGIDLLYEDIGSNPLREDALYLCCRNEEIEVLCRNPDCASDSFLTDTYVPLMGYGTDKGAYVILSFETIDYTFLSGVYDRFYGNPVEILRTRRLYLREFSLKDIDRLYEIYSTPGVTDFVEPLYEDREKEEEFLQAYIENMYGLYGFGLWAVCLADCGLVIGRAGMDLREIDGNYEIELGFVFDAAYRGLGYAYESCSGIIDYAKSKLEYDHINCLTDEHNLAARNLLSRLGFHRAGTITIEYMGSETLFQKFQLSLK